MGHHGRKNYCGNLLWQPCLTLLFPIALKEANESAYWFEVLSGLYEDLSELQVLANEASELRSLLQSIITSVKRTSKN